ncbi:pyrimidine reductase family protein [Mycobacterium hodleri]|uniref:pyrimidine reductase family protein n=1 Tax=Mycolicibacterium hodleri TaxID=49897 RepID=UPI0021F36388|nr:pyrimidine reductase family protein [Mycolicibacterium hodleri]MCV7133605.1 pyrimidine reductase family protein [Mycolicibacterium hodleri]
MVNVSDPDAATELTELGPLGSGFGTDDGRLAAFYSYPENLDRCWVRANMIASLDGGATDDGKAGGLAGPGDRALFSRMRQEADVILVGASTVRIENYSGAQMSLAERRERQGRGQTEVPPIAVVTHTADFEHDARIFTRTEVPPLIVTCHDTVPDAQARFGSTAEVIDASGAHPDRVDPAVVLSTFAGRRLLRVLSEGGPSLISLLTEHDLVDELCITIAPILVGGGARRISSGSGEAHTRMRRSHLLTDDEGYLYTRYVKDGLGGE